jgi:hypothetical protein
MKYYFVNLEVIIIINALLFIYMYIASHNNL